MKILFVTNLSGKVSGFHDIRDVKEMECSGMGLDYPLSLLEELSRYVEVDVYSPPLQGRVRTAPISASEIERFGITFTPQEIPVPLTTDLVKLLAGKDYDAVVVYAESMFAYIRNLDKISDMKKVLWFLSSPHQILLPEYKNVHVDLVLKVADKLGETEFGKEFSRLGLKTEWLPLSVDGRRFKNLGTPKLADVCVVGNINPQVYPFRVRAVGYLLRSVKHRLITSPCFGANYVNAINYSRVFLTCSGVWKFPVMKYFECLACGTLLMADDPLDAQDLGFKPDENYVSVADAYTPKVENPHYPIQDEEWEFHEDVLEQKLDYYLTHVEDRNRIARAGEALVRARHTDEVRAKELYNILRTRL